MVKRKYVKRIYVEVPYCDNCGTELEARCEIFTVSPPLYPYECPQCGSRFNFRDWNLPNRMHYEFGEEEENV